MPSSRNNQAWRREEIERLIAWMEENQDKLRGKQSAWHKEVKEEVYSAEGDSRYIGLGFRPYATVLWSQYPSPACVNMSTRAQKDV